MMPPKIWKARLRALASFRRLAYATKQILYVAALHHLRPTSYITISIHSIPIRACPRATPRPQSMIRSHTLRPGEDGAAFLFTSGEGDVIYTPAGHGADLPTYDLFVDDSRLPRSTRASTSSVRSPSLPATASPEEQNSQRRPSCHPSDGLSDEARLGLPVNWLVFPTSKTTASRASIPKAGQDAINFTKFDYTRPLEFSVSAEASATTETLPAYRSRANSVDQEETLPPYHVDDDLSDVVKAIYAQNADLLKKPKLKRARPLPREFTEQEQREIRRKTRHRIRVVTRNSLGLTVTIGLSCVAPQMLIAAAINGFCLGRGAHKLHQHLHFLQQNELHVLKRDVIVAVIEGVAVKLIFLAITLNNDDFLVLTHELVSAHSDLVPSSLHSLPGFEYAHHAFITPIEKIQELLGLPSMAQRAADMSAAGGWWDPAETVLKNMFLVGAVQVAMETAIDRVQDRMSRTSEHCRDVIARKRWEKECEEEVEERRKGQGLKWTRNRELMFRSGDRYESGYFRH